MPQSFINTGGFSSPVMPGFQLADPRLFQVGQNISKGLQSGVDMSGEMQRQAQARAMAPLQMQQIQEGIDTEKERGQLLQRQLMQPVRIPTGQEIQNVQRPHAFSQTAYDQAIAEGETPESAKALATRTTDNPGSDQYLLQKWVDPTTGETGSTSTLHKSAEDISKEEELARRYGLTGQASMITANANTVKANSGQIRAESGGAAAMRPTVEMGDDGKQHWFSKQYNPDTQQWERTQGGEASMDEAKIMNLKARSNEAQSVADKNARTPAPETSETKDIAKAATAIGLTPALFRELQKTPAGKMAINERSSKAALAKAGRPPDPLSPEAADIEAKAQAAIDAAPAANTPPAPTAASVGVDLGQYTVGRHHVDADGNGATYLGNGQWQLD